jgi:hypothetical protein
LPVLDETSRVILGGAALQRCSSASQFDRF